jgi:hypothetical protein
MGGIPIPQGQARHRRLHHPNKGYPPDQAAGGRMSRTCSDCEKQIWKGNKSGRCSRCVMIRINKDPNAPAWRAAAKTQTPEIKAKRSASLIRHYSDPANKALASERARRAYPKTLGTAKAQERAHAPDTRAKSGAATSRTKLAKRGVPLKYREDYLRFLRAGILADEAARLIREMALAEHARKHVAEPDTLSPFERQMEALNRGAGLTAKLNLPSRDYGMTLGGVSPL